MVVVANHPISGITTALAHRVGDDLEGEARELGCAHAELALKIRKDLSQSTLLLSGGETTVTVTGNGRGGRNVEYLLGLAIALDGAENIYALAADTDGIDGSEDNAGALITPTTLERARAPGLDPRAHLDHNDAYGFFEQLGDLVTTGVTTDVFEADAGDRIAAQFAGVGGVVLHFG